VERKRAAYHQEAELPMATENPTGGGRAVPLSIPPEQVQYLRRELTGFKSGLEEDAQTHADRPDARRWLAQPKRMGA
jgi:hypothetical protein